jgi:hypothetical protein
MSQRYIDLLRQKKISWTNWNYSDDFRSGAVWTTGTCSNGPWTTARLKPAGSWIRERMLNPADDFPGGTPTCEPVTASGNDGNVPANVLDNNLNTRWSASGDGQWIQFCLSSAANVTGVQIAFYKGNERSARFDILTGNDGTNWTTAASNLQSSGTSLNLETFTFTGRSAKYVRIVGHGNNVNAWNSYTEVKIQTSAGVRAQQIETLHEVMTAQTTLNSYPNPFHETSTIRFSLEKAGHARLEVLDITGKQVALVVNGNLPAGSHQRNLPSKQMPAGVYMLKLVHNGKTITKKLLKE